MSNVRLSPGNSKMGSIPSVSLPALKTCRVCGCNKECYALKLERLRKNVRAAYQANLDLLNSDSETYWREVKGAIMMARYFRFHVSGDIPDAEYFENMVRVAADCPHCEILCFTKKFNIINEWIAKGNQLPSNLHIIFSGWVGLEMENPYSLPEAHVRYRSGDTTARPDAIPCGGNCTKCAVTNGGCWTLKNGQQVVFDKH